MEELVSEKPLVVASKLGHSIRFTAGVPRCVPSVLVAECLAAGCQPAGKSTAKKAEASPEPDEPTPEQVAKIIRRILDEGDTSKLTTQGKVRIDAIEEELGVRISASCRTQARKLVDSGEI